MPDKSVKVPCETCKKEIPKDVALSAEGADYIYHFCCPDCMEHYAKEHPEIEFKLK